MFGGVAAAIAIIVIAGFTVTNKLIRLILYQVQQLNQYR